MLTVDYIIIGLYILFATGVGLYASRKIAGSSDEYFLAGRSLPWWLAGSSMVATTFATDTPLVVTGLIAGAGVAGNWLWWCVGIAHIVAALGFARLWRRLEVLTDTEIVKERYGGVWSKRLRTITAGYQAVFINCLVMGWILLAMRKLSIALFPEASPQLVTTGLVFLSVGYATLGGMHAVVITDMAQLALAFIGASALAYFALSDFGGIQGMLNAFETTYPDKSDSLLSMIPQGDLPGLPITLFALLLTIGWWKNAQGAGYIVQRLGACKTPHEAEKASLFFAVVHNALRPWPWILVGLCALLVWPLEGGPCSATLLCESPYQCLDGICAVTDREGTYPLMMTKYLPPGWLGLVVASMLAAFMSTMDTHINWGASYLINDLKFGRKTDAPAPLWHGRLGAFTLGIIALILSQFMTEIADIWILVIMLGGGIGSVWVGRWLWWRVSARVELTAMATATLLATIVLLMKQEFVFDVTNPLFMPELTKTWEILIVTMGTLVVWVSSAFIFPPESEQVLTSFFKKARPPAFGWTGHTGENHPETSPDSTILQRIVLGLIALYGTLFGMGWALLNGRTLEGIAAISLSFLAFMWLIKNPADPGKETREGINP